MAAIFRANVRRAISGFMPLWTGGVINQQGQRNGVKFVGTEGWIWVNRGNLEASKDEVLQTPLPDNAIHLEVSNNHMRNFFDCLRSRRDPVASVETGHYSTVVGHLIIIALRAGKKYQWDAAKETFVGEGAGEANRHLAREMRKPSEIQSGRQFHQVRDPD